MASFRGLGCLEPSQVWALSADWSMASRRVRRRPGFLDLFPPPVLPCQELVLLSLVLVQLCQELERPSPVLVQLCQGLGQQCPV